MAFLLKVKKCDLVKLAVELGAEPQATDTLIKLRDLITSFEGYEEEAAKDILHQIITDRQEQEALEKEEREREKEERERAFELEKLKLQTGAIVKRPSETAEGPKWELRKLIPEFNPKEEDIGLFLIIFERQLKFMKIPEDQWVAYLIGALPADIAKLIAREPEEESRNYQHIREILLRRFKLSAEKFRQLFCQHRKAPESTWRDFYFELRSYFEGWLSELNIKSYDQLKDLIIADQIKRKSPSDVRDHFLDEWTECIDPVELADKLETYDNLRNNGRRGPMYGNWKRNFPEQKNEAPRRENARWPQRRDGYERSEPRRDYTKFQAQAYERNGRDGYKSLQCYSCGSTEHLRNNCPNLEKRLQAAANRVDFQPLPTEEDTLDIMTAKISIPVTWPINPKENINALKKIGLKCGANILEGVVDTGAQITVIRADLVKDIPCDGEGKIKIVSAFGETELAQLKIIPMEINDGCHGEVPITCAVSEKLVSDMLVSWSAFEALNANVELFGSRFTPNVIFENGQEPITVAFTNVISGTVENTYGETGRVFVKMQQEDETLREAWKSARERKENFDVMNEVLIHTEVVGGEEIRQVVLPKIKRQYVLEMAHEVPLAGHLGEQKTRQRIKYSFYWPNMKKDVKLFCESCKICQLRKGTTYRDRIPIQPIVRPDNPFEVWSVDCIGPLEPPSRRGHKYIICAVDLCTRWAEAIPVRNITAKSTCDVLMKIFSSTGFPKTICSDQGTNFTAQLTREFMNILGVSPRFSTPGHPESMGAVERYNKTLKEMLSKNIQENGRDWDVHLPYLLFAYREVPHCTTGMSPFQLVYGRLPRGPLTWVKDHWTGIREIPIGASKNIEQYLKDLKSKLESAHTIASENSERNQEDYTRRYNLRAREKKFEVGEQVLILESDSSHKLLKKWIGPVRIIKLTRPHSVLVQLEDGATRELHVNKIRPFIARVEQVGLIFEQDEEFGDISYAPTGEKVRSLSDIQQHIHSQERDITRKQGEDLTAILEKYKDVFAKIPGQAKVPGHGIRVTEECKLKRLHPYRVPIALQEEVERQVQELLELKMIEPSESEWAHPVVCVAKKNGSVRLCVDYKQLNKYTIPDAYPMKRATELLYDVGKANFITVLDLTKGYWQIPMRPEAKAYTAFVTHSGQYQWNVMPFGLKNSGSTFQRSMDKVLSDHREYCRSYIDDVAIFSKSWNEHLGHIDKVFKTLVEAGLTINLEKCEFGKKRVRFLGHIVG